MYYGSGRGVSRHFRMWVKIPWPLQQSTVNRNRLQKRKWDTFCILTVMPASRAVARTLIGGGGGCIFIYSGSARLASFEINFISKETSQAEPEYMNMLSFMS